MKIFHILSAPDTPYKAGSKRNSFVCRRTAVSVTNRLLCRVLSRDAAEHDDVGDRVTAQAVFAVYAAGHFSCGIQTGYHASVGLYDLRLAVDFDAAHRVVYGGHGFQNIKRRFFVPYFTSPAKETIGKNGI